MAMGLVPLFHYPRPALYPTYAGKATESTVTGTRTGTWTRYRWARVAARRGTYTGQTGGCGEETAGAAARPVSSGLVLAGRPRAAGTMRARTSSLERWRGLRSTRHFGRRLLILYAITA